jgi:hypothetical protein
MAQLLDLGKVRFNFTGTYNAATQYEFNDVVKYGGSAYVYISNTAATGNIPTDTAYWARMSDGIQFENEYNVATQYQENDVVIYGPQTYIALQDTLGNDPTNATYWKPFTEGVGYQGDWVTGTDYLPGDVVRRGGSLYIATAEHTAQADFSSDVTAGNWDSFVKGVRSVGDWQNANDYLVDDIVSDGVNSYIALTDHTSGAGLFQEEPAGRWSLFVAGADALPSQLGESGKLLTTNGIDATWTSDISITSAIIDGDESFKVGPNASAVAGPTGHNLSGVAGVFTTPQGGSSAALAQVAVVNTDADGLGSTDVVVYTEDGDQTEGWNRLGVTGDSFDTNQYFIVGPHDGYVFTKAPAGTAGNGNLVLATGNTGANNNIVIAAQGVDDGASQVTVTTAGVNISPNTVSSSPTSGALIVGGGVGIAGNLNVAGNQSVVGNVTIQGSISVSGGQFVTQSLSSSDPLLFVGSGNPANNFDLGFLAEAKFPTSTYRALFGEASLTDDVATLNTVEYTATARSLASNIATITIGAHDFEEGDPIAVSGIGSPFDGDYIVTAFDATTVSYEKTNANISSAPTSGTVSFRIITGDRGDLIAGDVVVIAGAASPFDGSQVIKTATSSAITFDLVNANVGATALDPAATATRTTRSEYSGIAKNNTTGIWNLFSGLSAKPVTSIDFTLDEIVYDSLRLGGVEAVGGVNVVADNTERDSTFADAVHGTIIFRKDKNVQEVYTGTKWDAMETVHPFLLMGV